MTPFSLLALGAVSAVALVGLVLDQPAVALEESRIGSAVMRAVVDPEPDERGE